VKTSVTAVARVVAMLLVAVADGAAPAGRDDPESAISELTVPVPVPSAASRETPPAGPVQLNAVAALPAQYQTAQLPAAVTVAAGAVRVVALVVELAVTAVTGLVACVPA
jgi:hypothetical protein